MHFFRNASQSAPTRKMPIPPLDLVSCARRYQMGSEVQEAPGLPRKSYCSKQVLRGAVLCLVSKIMIVIKPKFEPFSSSLEWTIPSSPHSSLQGVKKLHEAITLVLLPERCDLVDHGARTRKGAREPSQRVRILHVRLVRKACGILKEKMLRAPLHFQSRPVLQNQRGKAQHQRRTSQNVETQLSALCSMSAGQRLKRLGSNHQDPPTHSQDASASLSAPSESKTCKHA